MRTANFKKNRRKHPEISWMLRESFGAQEMRQHETHLDMMRSMQSSRETKERTASPILFMFQRMLMFWNFTNKDWEDEIICTYYEYLSPFVWKVWCGPDAHRLYFQHPSLKLSSRPCLKKAEVIQISHTETFGFFSLQWVTIFCLKSTQECTRTYALLWQTL